MFVCIELHQELRQAKIPAALANRIENYRKYKQVSRLWDQE